MEYFAQAIHDMIIQSAADAIAHGCPDVADALIDMATEEDG
jgi:type III secretion system FlhB-like substrate exporter